MSGNENSNTLVKECLSPQAENVNISHVYVGCTINESKSETQPNTGGDGNPEGKHCSPKSELQGKIENALKIQYTEIILPSLPWLEKCDIPIEKYTTLHLESENEREVSRIIDLENLFDNINEQKRKRILVESQPGFGKTTLAHKIVSDWSRGSEYVKHFKFAILIILREYGASSLKEELKSVIDIEGYDDDDFWSIINTDETLLIFDGLDEISGRLGQDIQEILHDNKEKYKMTIVTTCRIGLSDLSGRVVKSTFRGVSRKKRIWSKKITILGINAQNQLEFIEKFVDENDKEILMPRLAKIIDSRTEMFNSPLLLILLVYVTSENHNVIVNSDADLYKALVDCIIRRSIHKVNPDISSVNFTIFTSSCSESIFDYFKKKFINFGEICLDHILKDELLFGYCLENEAIHQLGFLLKHVTKKCFGPVVRYEGFHLSILEFAAAVYMAHYFAMNDNRFHPEDIDKLFKIVYNKKLTSMVLPFLCDLLGKGIASLISELSRYYIFFWSNLDIVEFLIQKCLMNNVGGEHFVKIIPPYLTISRMSDSVDSVITQHLAKFLVFELDRVRYFREMRHPTNLRGLICNGIIDRFENIEDILDIAQNITCESLSYSMYNDLPYENMANCLKIFRRVSSDCKNLYLRKGFYVTDLNKCITSGILVGEKLSSVIIELGNVEKEVIAKLIECNRIENLVLVQSTPIKNYPKDLAATVSHLARTINCVNSLFVLCGGLCFGWDDFFKSGEKCLKESNDTNANLEDTVSLFDSIPLDDIARTIFPLKPSQLSCRFYKLESAGNWNSWDMIVELILTVTDSSERGLADLSKFKSLKILTLIIHFGHERREESVENIIGSIKGLILTRLKLKWFSSDYYFYGSIINGVRQLVQNKAIFCSECIRFEVTLSTVRPDLFDFETIKSALLTDSKIVFCIASCYWYDLCKIVTARLNDLLFYNIKYSYSLYTIQNMPLNICFHCNTGVHHMLELTLG